MKQCGFTLIELSIVLVIIGLITGSVLVGRDLVSAAGVRAQIAQIEKYQTAVNTFRGKYRYLPGDMAEPSASQYGFGARGAFDGEGDGNGVLEGVTVDAAASNNGAVTWIGETLMFWSDLSSAHMIEGTFSAASSTQPPPVDPVTGSGLDLYFPAAKLGRSNYVYIWSGGMSAGRPAGPDGKNYFALAAITQVDHSVFAVAGTTVQEAYSIDKKIDDGLPQLGRVTATYVDGIYYWAAGGGNTSGYPVPVFDAASSDNGDGGEIENTSCCGKGYPTTIATPYNALNCYDNNGVVGVEQYSMSRNAASVNCALSFQFQ